MTPQWSLLPRSLSKRREGAGGGSRGREQEEGAGGAWEAFLPRLWLSAPGGSASNGRGHGHGRAGSSCHLAAARVPTLSPSQSHRWPSPLHSMVSIRCLDRIFLIEFSLNCYKQTLDVFVHFHLLLLMLLLLLLLMSVVGPPHPFTSWPIFWFILFLSIHFYLLELNQWINKL